MLIGFLIAGATIAAFLVAYKLVDLYYVDGSSSFVGTAKLNWKNLRDFYWIAPDRWRYQHVLKRGSCINTTSTKVLMYTDDSLQRVRVKLTLPALVRFHIARLFHKNYDGTNILLSSVQNDIDTLREVSKQQINEAIERMNQIDKEKDICLKV